MGDQSKYCMSGWPGLVLCDTRLTTDCVSGWPGFLLWYQAYYWLWVGDQAYYCVIPCLLLTVSGWPSLLLCNTMLTTNCEWVTRLTTVRYHAYYWLWVGDQSYFCVIPCLLDCECDTMLTTDYDQAYYCVIPCLLLTVWVGHQAYYCMSGLTGLTTVWGGDQAYYFIVWVGGQAYYCLSGWPGLLLCEWVTRLTNVGVGGWPGLLMYEWIVTRQWLYKMTE